MGQSTICNMKQFIPFLYKEIRQCLSIEFLDCHIVVSAVCGKTSTGMNIYVLEDSKSL